MSPNSEWVLRSRRVLVDGAVAPRCVHVADGTIVAVTDWHDLPAGARLHDVGDLLVMAGLTDVHVHINDPGRDSWEGFATATRAAAAGGVTTLVDMPLNSTPVTTTSAAFDAKLAAAEGRLSVDVGFWGGIVPDDIDQLPALLASGVLGLKAFLVHSGIEDFPNVTVADLARALPLAAPTGLPVLVHCELDTSGRPPLTEAPDGRSYRQYLASRPGRWELDAIDAVLELARRTGARVHIVHLSCADALPRLRAARAEGLKVSVETCPHYLVLEAEGIPDGDTRYKCAPPIREHANREALWAGLADGTIDFVATDHSPCPPDLKRLETGSFSEAWGGIASLQFLLPLVWTEAARRGHSLADLERWLCRRPADFAGLGSSKGRLAAGYRADLVVWNPEAPLRIAEAAIEYRHKITPYSGLALRGVVAETWLGGVPVWGPAALDPAQPSPVGRTQLRSTSALDALTPRALRARLASCSASTAWVEAVAAAAPFGDYRRLSEVATSAWKALGAADLLQAYAGHARIGQKYREHREQAGVVGASQDVLDRLEAANIAYEAKFGHVFLVFATGKTAADMLALLEARLTRTVSEEFAEASAQCLAITLFRLAQDFDPEAL